MIKMMITAEQKARFDAFCEAQGMTQIQVASRLMKWFCDQDEDAQKTIIGVYSGPMAWVAAMLCVIDAARKGQAGLALEPGERERLEKQLSAAVAAFERAAITASIEKRQSRRHEGGKEEKR
jgi:hypothetical protein